MRERLSHEVEREVDSGGDDGDDESLRQTCKGGQPGIVSRYKRLRKKRLAGLFFKNRERIPQHKRYCFRPTCMKLHPGVC